MSEQYPTTYAVDVKFHTGEDDVLVVNCADVGAALDLMKADLNYGEGITQDKGCIINDCYIEHGGTTIMFTPADDREDDDNSGTLTIFFGGETPLSKRQNIQLYIDDYNNLIAKQGEITYEPIR